MSVTEAARSGLDVMLMDAAEGGPPRFLAPGAGVKVGARLAVRPRRAGGRLAALAGELGRTALGRSELQPARGDRRFGDRAWQDNWLLHRLMQSYLAVGEAVDGLISDAQAGLARPSAAPASPPATCRRARADELPAGRTPRCSRRSSTAAA